MSTDKILMIKIGPTPSKPAVKLYDYCSKGLKLGYGSSLNVNDRLVLRATNGLITGQIEHNYTVVNQAIPGKKVYNLAREIRTTDTAQDAENELSLIKSIRDLMVIDNCGVGNIKHIDNEFSNGLAGEIARHQAKKPAVPLCNYAFMQNISGASSQPKPIIVPSSRIRDVFSAKIFSYCLSYVVVVQNAKIGGREKKHIPAIAAALFSGGIIFNPDDKAPLFDNNCISIALECGMVLLDRHYDGTLQNYVNRNAKSWSEKKEKLIDKLNHPDLSLMKMHQLLVKYYSDFIKKGKYYSDLNNRLS